MDYVTATRIALQQRIKTDTLITSLRNEVLNAPITTADEELQRIKAALKDICLLETTAKRIDAAIARLDKETKFLIKSLYIDGLSMRDLSESVHLPESEIKKKTEKGIRIMAGLMYRENPAFARDGRKDKIAYDMEEET